jgi:hypothetical protein
MLLGTLETLLRSELAQRIADIAPQLCDAFLRFIEADTALLIPIASCLSALFVILPPDATTVMFVSIARAFAMFNDIIDFGARPSCSSNA